MWVPLFGGIPYNSPMVGSFFGVVVSVLIALYNTKRASESNRKHILAVEKTSLDQIKYKELWRNIQRKQLLKSLIEELNTNIIIYNQLLNDVEEKKYNQRFSQFILVILEKCLVNTPIDDDSINHNLLAIYYMVKIHDNKVSATRTANITKESLEGFINSITDDYKKNKWIFECTLKSLADYEKKIKT